MPPEAIRWSISKMPLSRVPGGRRDVGATVDHTSAAAHGVAGDEWRVEIIADDDDGDVVGGAAIERQRHQRLAGLLRFAFADAGENLAVLDMASQPVAAQQEGVAWQQRPVNHFKLGLISDADRARDDIAPRPGARLLRGEPA
jgi:hypothetical protein